MIEKVCQVLLSRKHQGFGGLWNRSLRRERYIMYKNIFQKIPKRKNYLASNNCDRDFQPQWLHFCWNLVRRTDQEAEINKRQQFTGLTQWWASVNQLDPREKERQVKDVAASFLLDVSKNWVFKLPKREENSEFIVVKTHTEVWNCIKLTDAWKQNNYQQTWNFSLNICTYVVGKEPAGTRKTWRSKCTQDIDKTHHCKLKINQPITENVIYIFTASSPSQIVQILEWSYTCFSLGQSHRLESPNVSGTWFH